MINKSLFIKNKVKKVISIPQKGKKSLLKFKIYNYNEKSKQMIFDMYEKKSKLGIESFELTVEELRLVFNVFTDYLFDIDELSDIIENPNIYFEEIFYEINLILCDLVKLFVQEQRIKIEQLNIENDVLELNQLLVDKVKSLDIDNSIGDVNG